MTLRLILMRHAKSDWGSVLLSDHERPLNSRGQMSARTMGAWLRDSGDHPDLTLSSDARRTQETVEGVGVACEIRLTRDLYHASADAMLRVLHGAGTARRVLMVGHNPGIGDFAERLLRAAPAHARFYDYPTCATLIADFDVAAWRDVRLGTGLAVAFAIPREVLAAGAGK